MIKIYSLLLVVLFYSFAFGQNDYRRLKTSIEQKVSHTQIKETLTLINENYHHLNPILKTEVEVIKMEIVNELALVDEAFARS
ncbi:hypothetical protein [Chryseobacterium sp. VAUSW3]|uniref:hypothetical protein n=1 Tax=Chryseobacterium sp. VAUSW3 TaxID=2010998 RepID=UPI000B4D377A|nr:hypothetical protein [Chryseobacterium sp. VAUSW3]OWR15043.1 hypothetical protein CDW55_01010 [Chryseobacterium sp. VAUSW3]